MLIMLMHIINKVSNYGQVLSKIVACTMIGAAAGTLGSCSDTKTQFLGVCQSEIRGRLLAPDSFKLESVSDYSAAPNNQATAYRAILNYSAKARAGDSAISTAACALDKAGPIAATDRSTIRIDGQTRAQFDAARVHNAVMDLVEAREQERQIADNPPVL